MIISHTSTEVRIFPHSGSQIRWLRGEFLRGEAPLKKLSSPFPLVRGRGIKEDGVYKGDGVYYE